MMGQNLYGFDWKLPFKQGNPPAKAVSSVAAVALARKYNVPIRYDFTAQAHILITLMKKGTTRGLV